MDELTSKASSTILPITTRTGVWPSVKAGPWWKWCNASIVWVDAVASVNLGNWVPVSEGGCSNSFNLSATVIRDIEEAR